MRWLRKHVAQFDVVHIHLGRDLVTLPATHIVRRSGVPYVAQPHGMIARSSNRLAGPLDFLMTRRNLQSAKAVYFLTSTERTELAAVAQLRNLRFLPNGVPATTDQPQSPSGKPEVLFLARLHPRKRPDMFVDAAAILLKQGLEANFVIAGPDEGMLTSLKAEVSGSHLPDIRFEGPVAPENVMQRLCRSAIYVLPSVDEPFPMTVLEAMSAATPVIITTSCGLAEHVRNSRGGIVIEPTTTALVSAIKSLLESPGKAREIGNAARAYVRTHMSVDAVVTELEAMYSTANRDNKTSPRKGLRRYLD
nr:glycosyltransferase [Smaragdicoccus niigatensis]